MFDIVERTRLTLHDVNKDRAVIHRDPLGVLLSGDGERMDMGGRTHEIVYLVRDSGDLGVTLCLA